MSRETPRSSEGKSYLKAERLNKDVNRFLVKGRKFGVQSSRLKRLGKHSRFFINAAEGSELRTKGHRHKDKSLSGIGRIVGRGERMEIQARKIKFSSFSENIRSGF